VIEQRAKVERAVVEVKERPQGSKLWSGFRAAF
jgi:hypothetical protein